jgi:hypothetical protein
MIKSKKCLKIPVSCEDGICVPEGQEKWIYGNCVQFLILICGTSSPGNAHTLR